MARQRRSTSFAQESTRPITDSHFARCPPGIQNPSSRWVLDDVATSQELSDDYRDLRTSGTRQALTARI
jgi:hypothetical protein